MFKFNSVPAYSIGKARPKQPEESLPGPGAYDTTKLLDIKQKHVGTTVIYKPSNSKSARKLNDIGPGAYDVNLKSHIKGYYNDKSKNEKGNKYINEAPGPGQYDTEKVLQNLKKTNGIVFDRSKKDVGQTSLPIGPGSYSTDKYTAFNGKNKAWSFNKAMYNDKMDREIPGPAAYSYEKYLDMRDKKGGFSLSKTSRYDKFDNKAPGPGTYNNNVRAITNKGCYFPKSQEEDKKENIPGPGHYNPNVDKFKTKAHGIKFEKTSKLDKTETIPGPGQYNDKITAFNSKGPKFNKSKRYNNKNDDLPAPGQYNTKLMEKTTGVIFDKRHGRLESLNPTPGPGQYNYQEKHKAKFALVKAKYKNEPNEIPGPGHYNAQFDDWKKRVPAFDKTGRLDKDNSVPIGPGHYNIPHSIPDVPKYNYPDIQQRKIHI